MAEKDAVMEIIEKALGELEGPLDGGTSNKAILDRIQVRHEGLTEPPTVPDQISLLLKIAEKAAELPKKIIRESKTLNKDLEANEKKIRSVYGLSRTGQRLNQNIIEARAQIKLLEKLLQ